MFEDDPQILEFLENEENFKGAVIDEEEHQANLRRRNFITKGVRTLEGIFGLNNKFRRPKNVKTHSSSMQFELINLVSKAEPKYLNLGKCCSPRERHKFINLFKQYKDVFAWTYEDMKTYDSMIIHHVFSIKAGVQPY